MSYAHKLRYAGSDPFQPEQEREDITAEEMELLEQDETYRKLAEVRWLASELEEDLAHGEAIPAATKQAMFEAVAMGDAPLDRAVFTYVKRWLAVHRSQEASR